MSGESSRLSLFSKTAIEPEKLDGAEDHRDRGDRNREQHQPPDADFVAKAGQDTVYEQNPRLDWREILTVEIAVILAGGARRLDFFHSVLWRRGPSGRGGAHRHRKDQRPHEHGMAVQPDADQPMQDPEELGH